MKQIGNSLLQRWKKLGGLTAVQLQLRKGCQIIQSYNFELLNKFDVDGAMAHQTIRFFWTLMRDHFRRCTRKGVADPSTRIKILHEGCVDRWKKDETYRHQMYINGHTKEELQSWDAQVREGLGDYAECHQPGQKRELIHSGWLKIKHNANVATPVKQDPEYHL